MLHDINFVDDETLNIEQILPLIQAQRIQKEQKKSETQSIDSDAKDLTLALNQAVEKNNGD